MGFFDSAGTGAADDSAVTAMTETKPKRRWFSFSIRDLLWLTLVVGILIDWRLSVIPKPPFDRDNRDRLWSNHNCRSTKRAHVCKLIFALMVKTGSFGQRSRTHRRHRLQIIELNRNRLAPF